MVTTIQQDNEFRGGAWQRASTRAAILGAARRLVDRGGLDRLSLTAVAREADFAPTTVFAYYANKSDLLLSVLADDLEKFARTMRGLGPLDPPEPVQTELNAAPETADEAHSPVRLRLVDAPPAAHEYAALPPPSPQQRDSAFEGDREQIPERIVMDAVVQQLSELQDAVAKLESRPADAWLERRFREFERGLAALQSRPEVANDTPPALTAVEVGMHALAARVESLENKHQRGVEDLARRLREGSEQIERRLREKLSDHEIAVARDRVRLDAVENAAFAVAPQYFQKNTPEQPVMDIVPARETSATTALVPVTVEAPAEPTANASAELAPSTEEQKPVEDAAPPAQEESFLAIARRSAMAAAEQNTSSSRSGGAISRISKRTLGYIAGGLGLAVAVIWTGVYFKAHAISTASARVVSHTSETMLASGTPVRHRTTAAAPATPADLAAAFKLLDGTPGNDAEAARLLSRAAEQGNALAAFKLATLYKAGRGVTADPARAFHWFEFAASRGNCKAMQNLAVAYAEGWGTTKDMEQAARWFTRAAALGLTDAEFNLAVLYERGMGVPQSLTDAYKWYLVAAAQGDPESKTRVSALKSQLAPTDLAAAEEAASSFKPAPLDASANAAPANAPAPAG